MFKLDLKSRKSIYEQIVDGFKRMIVSGELKPEDKLPSVRDLSSILTVNPNTIQKAYSALETQGWVYMVSGRGCFVSGESHDPDASEIKEIFGRIRELADQLVYRGLTQEEIISTLEKEFREGRGAK